MKVVEIFRKNLSASLTHLGWTQADLARRLNWTPAEVNDVLRKQTPRLERIESIAGVLGLQVSELLTSNDVPKPRVERIPLSEELRFALREASLTSRLSDWEEEALLLLRQMPEIQRDHHITVMREALKPYRPHSLKKDDKAGA